jgi:uncharacterized RDD family membrane protein YckC
MIERKYQTFWRRFWAGFVDGLIFIPLYWFDTIIWNKHDHVSVYLLLIWYTIYQFSFVAYSVLMHGSFGQTLGKMITRVKVFDVSEQKRLAMSQAVRRDIFLLITIPIDIALAAPKILSGVNIMDEHAISYGVSFFFMMFTSLGWFLTELITMLLSKKRRALHDFIAGSVVIKLPQQSAALDRGLPAAPSELGRSVR